MKELKTSIFNRDAPDRYMRKSVCRDCIFWYQCRRGNVDCGVRLRQNAFKTAI
ncbi:hypothetical protein [Methanocella conradii]|uniref:hypothetical protein n=1 Tax=Methanocella conradii TaxID=1175444 RepID=UPI00157C682A|nr:hypothetical protein [Methanocella conradii]